MPDIALHIFQARAIVQGGGYERGTHGMSTVAMIEAHGICVFAEDSVDADRMQVTAWIALSLILTDRPKQSAIEIIPMAGSRQVFLDALSGLRIDRQGKVFPTLADEVKRFVPAIGVVILDQQRRDLRTARASL